MLATMALLVMIAFQFVFLFNFIYSLFQGPKAEANPWKANTLEWPAPSPPPHGNFAGAARRSTAARTSTACRAATTTTGRSTCTTRGPEFDESTSTSIRSVRSWAQATRQPQPYEDRDVFTPIATRRVMGIPTGRLAVWWVLASEIVIFGGLLGAYIMHRLGHPAWADQAVHTNMWAGAFNTSCC